jgi:hypothetical protein
MAMGLQLEMTVAQLVKQIAIFIEPKLLTQNPATGLSPEQIGFCP